MPCRQARKDFPNAADGKQAAHKAKAFDDEVNLVLREQFS